MAIALVQAPIAAQQAGSGSDTVAKTFAGNVTAGNCIVAGVVTNGATFAAGNVTDTIGNSYTLGPSVLHASGFRVAIYYALNIAGGANTVTFNPAANDFLSIGIAEFSGVATAAATDGTSTKTNNTGTSHTSTAFSTTLNDVVVACMTHDGSVSQTIVGAASFSDASKNVNTANMPIALIYRIVAAGSITPTWTLGSGANGCACALALTEGTAPAFMPTQPVMVRQAVNRASTY